MERSQSSTTAAPKRIHVHDNAGHPFQVELSRALARRGHQVLHTYCASFCSPRGKLNIQTDDPASFDIEAIYLTREFAKYSPLARWRQEAELGNAVVEVSREFGPDVIVSANTPLFAQRRLLDHSARSHVTFVNWVQDIHGLAIRGLLSRKLPGIGQVAGRLVELYERKLFADSEEVVIISDDFLPWIPERHRRRGSVTTIQNWAPLGDLPVLPKSNPWSEAHQLQDRTCLLYAGTLGMKHNPELLVHVAAALRHRDDARLVVLSEGPGASYLAQRKRELRLDNLLLQGFAEFSRMPEVLATADVLLTILEPEAGQFAVPSKVLTYMCSARPLLLAVPAENLAARIVRDSNAGFGVSPEDPGAFVKAAMELVDDPERRAQLGANARRYAERTFSLAPIAARFESIIARGGRERAG